jgi:hypothetical protein
VTGFEAYASPAVSLENLPIQQSGGTETGMTDSGLAFLIESWPRLNAVARASVLAAVRVRLIYNEAR